MCLLARIMQHSANDIRMDEANREGIWFPLLDALLETQQKMAARVPRGKADVFKASTYVDKTKEMTKYST